MSVLQPGLASRRHGATGRRSVADPMVAEVARPVVLDDAEVQVSTSVGVGRADLTHVTTTDDVDALVRSADEAMYRAKQAGKNRVDHA